ncbi:hypothetical protein JS756_25725 [Streptomyces actuosus]|uniref:Uncharacterized protein n=1 Tax=Streptomyces actuosus TaxID=1885 RepID=A0ABS2VWE7_STRAS|nr:hypothetical protein [Streptomyces actuosus]MBN0047443.1 hypothetical protein [Streptomyces actuosus]
MFRTVRRLVAAPVVAVALSTAALAGAGVIGWDSEPANVSLAVAGDVIGWD